ncbi:MAG: hypothetical protein HFF06_00875 [Oscillospiraceae bacterium]|jgi:hypothetical protein|nr:hypothetical protein [Oscillospiraceae bacterium]
MKHKEPIALFLIGVLLSGIVTVGASEAGSAANPLIALNWLRETFIPGAVSDAEERVNEGLGKLENDIQNTGPQGTELRVKRGDILRLESGSTLTLLAGDTSLSSDSQGTVVDMTDGKEVLIENGTSITKNHRYLAAEKSKIAFSVVSDTAVVRLSGTHELIPSQEIDYNALADALKAMGLFRGSDVPYGSGYDLESTPTRIQGLVMFLRLIGEEQAALSYPGSGITYADVPDWALPYVAYAYDKGYTKGQEIDEQWRVVFGSDDPLAARDYITFLLRALGYADGSGFQWETAIADARVLGVLTEGEERQLTDQPFLRAQVAYLSYTALSAHTAEEGGCTLLDRLISSGSVSAAASSSAMKGLENQRL